MGIGLPVLWVTCDLLGKRMPVQCFHSTKYKKRKTAAGAVMRVQTRSLARDQFSASWASYIFYMSVRLQQESWG